MILLTILLIVLTILATILLVTTGVVGTAVVVLFGDLIVFALAIWLIIKLFKKKKK